MNTYAILGCVCALTSTVLAGDLNPPAGPVAPTMKTLDEVEPSIPISQDTTPGDADSIFRVGASGRYHLTAQSFGVLPEGWLEIAGSDIEIDLRGHRVQLSANSTAGIFASEPSSRNITIRNGTIVGGGGTAIDLPTVPNVRVENVNVNGAGGSGILLGPSGRVIDCVVDTADNDGINISGNGGVEECSVQSVGGFGIRVSTGTIAGSTVASAGMDDALAWCFEVACCGTVSDCSAVGAQCGGFSGQSDVIFDGCIATGVRLGFSTGDGCVVRESGASFCSTDGYFGLGATQYETCQSRGNADDGFECSRPGSMVDCIAEQNGDTGFELQPASMTVRGCRSFGNGGIGFNGGQGSLFESCVAQGNTNDGFVARSGTILRACVSRGNDDGYAMFEQTTAESCTAHTNNADGFDVDGATLSGCTIEGNAQNGIRSTDNSKILDCSIQDNDDNGILLTGIFNIVRDNTIGRNSDEGEESDILVDGDSNFIIDNFVSGGINAIRINGDLNTAIRNLTSCCPVNDLGSGNTVPVPLDPANPARDDNIQY